MRFIQLVSILVLVWPYPAASATDFPLREKYPDVETISTQELAAGFASFTIVDVRSVLEFDVIHIAGAINNPVARSTFAGHLEEISNGDRSHAWVFYCNGHTCAKSYKSARIAKENGYTAVRAYDVGIFEWTNAHPDRAVLLGESPVDPADLISKAAFEQRSLAADRFIAGAQDPDAVLIDLREPMQRKRTPDFGTKRPQNFYMAKIASRLPVASFQKRMTGKTLYIFDATGKQVRWLQYHLERHGYQNYYFLNGGVWSVYGEDGAN